ncbi:MULTISPECIES: family 78 glycoside hydrolase catalytic domain [unclassified Streptomyces]|uniref:family 78 glycoside hydrolase catalytic domain n=1 Tax=unclassified Streptomyces TaxID=2593676 RepID=UPI00247320AF|nr:MULTISPECIES: family 78 glycoside hydrolase catalytic domain [unclassified Streptomyces]MDH6451880.1 alpha-L-rhamnosidase [Streptomyces sp. SAI-119]MDH6497565.1 alpha-L-rhamnosidase [Streptomyces sp. SAI-149]
MGERWNRRNFLRGTAATAGTGIVAAAGGTTAAAATGAPTAGRAARTPRGGGLEVVRTSVEYADTLLGTDVERPRLSWELAAPGRGARQTAYRIRVTRDRWGGPPVWDSGKVTSDRTVGIVYDGPAPLPRTRYHWRVQVWDAAGRASRWSEPRWWETTLSPTDWKARWIGADAPEQPPSFEGASWIWSPGATTSDAPEGPRWFRARLALPAGTDVRRATVVATADDDFTLYVDGEQVLGAPQQTDGWRTGRTADVTARVRAAGAEVVVAALATNRGGASVNPGGLLVRLIVDTASGPPLQLVTGPGWRSAEAEQQGWQRPDFDDSGWAQAVVLAPYGQGPWGSGVTVAVPEQPAPLLRRSFTVPRKITRARLYISGLAYYEAEINGRRVGHQVLDPGFTDYDETVLYAVHDVTGLLKRGENALGVTLGRGFFGMTTPNVWNWHNPPWHGEPRLLAQLEIDHPDGSRTTVVSDGDWRLTEGPTRSNSLYAGETYDARLAPAGWSGPGFDDTGWRAPGVQPAPRGKLRAQPHDPIEIVETVRPTAISELAPGVHLVDMGRTMAGWTRLTVRGAAEGTVVRLTHGEKLRSDGSVHAQTDHVPGRFQTDEYICAGGREEVWEPSFSYKGFRYVQISGLPARPTPDQVLGRVVHTRVEEVSSFACSEPFYEWLDGAMRRTVLNNLHGIPTDTPMYEKNGWTGDAQLGAPVMTYAFGVHRFLSKWLGDLADSQTGAGQLPVIVPSGGWGYGDLGPSPEWTTVYPFVAREMFRVYGDERAARDHWAPLVRYLDWELSRLRDGLAITALGDYLPPGYGGNPPEDTRLTATAYLHRALLHTAELGDLLGEGPTSARYRQAADGLRTAFNAAFLAPEGHYRTSKDPDYRQTSNAIPLAFGLVPAGARASVLDSLVKDIEQRGNHLNTGALGTSVLLRVLCAQGRPDVAHAIATQRTYPSWGYWHENGADTMWEMWPLDSRSRDHYFQGTVAQWLYENVAGLRPGDAGYRTFTVRPDARTGVNWARTSIRTVRGPAAVSWTRVDDRLRLSVRVPVGATADVHVPGTDRSRVTAPTGARHLRTEPGFVLYRVAHGEWEFTGEA